MKKKFPLFGLCHTLLWALVYVVPALAAYATVTPHPQQNMVVSAHYLASKIGSDILKAGGNAIDAAVAVGYALAVVHPCCGNIGGGGFMLIHLTKGNKNIFLNFRETAPQHATPTMFLDQHHRPILKQSTFGYRAIAIPGTVLGLDTALRQYGTMNRQQVMAPAIQLAEKGFALSPSGARLINQYHHYFMMQPNTAAIFTKNGQYYQAGDLLRQHNLAGTLASIASQGPRAFYHGHLTTAMVRASQQHGGLLTQRDFQRYTVTTAPPLHCTYRGYDIFSAPPPSSGGVVLCEILHILEQFPLRQMGWHTANATAVMIQAMKYAFLDREQKLGDPAFVHNPITHLLSKPYARQLAKQIMMVSPGLAQTPTGKDVKHTTSNITVHESANTTHYSILDKQGNAVAVTYTINGFFGAKMIPENTGFFLNNEMDDFTSSPGMPNKFMLQQAAANDIRPGKRPLSSMTPTLVFHNHRLMLLIGSPGGPRIITAVLLTLLNIIDYRMTLHQAINAPRFHYQAMPDIVDIEDHAFSDGVLRQLHQRYHYHFAIRPPWSAVESILIYPSGHVEGGNDNRRPDGAAIGSSTATTTPSSVYRQQSQS